MGRMIGRQEYFQNLHEPVFTFNEPEVTDVDVVRGEAPTRPRLERQSGRPKFTLRAGSATLLGSLRRCGLMVISNLRPAA